MNWDEDLDSEQLQAELQEISTAIWKKAQQCQGNSLKVLFLLRTLENLHRKIQEQIFQPSLPDNRKNLYDLLKDIEETGGWPYIERMKLQDLLVNWREDSTTAEPSDSSDTD